MSEPTIEEAKAQLEKAHREQVRIVTRINDEDLGPTYLVPLIASLYAYLLFGFRHSPDPAAAYEAVAVSFYDLVEVRLKQLQEGADNADADAGDEDIHIPLVH